MKLDRSTILQKLNWPTFYFNWPPHDHPWSNRDQIKVLLWLSTLYKSAEDLRADFKEVNFSSYLKELEWLFPPKEVSKTWQEELEDSSIHSLINFSCNCLSKALLWHNPDYHWPSGLTTAVEVSIKNLYTLTPSVELNSSSFLGSDGWGDLGWVKHEGHYGGYIHTFYELLKLSEGLNQENLQEAKHVAHKSYKALEFAINMFWESIEGAGEVVKIITQENRWCDKIITFDYNLSTERK